ncbi:MAG: lytic transglycosylase domain-containing protein [Myxococcota bacterium]
MLFLPCFFAISAGIGQLPTSTSATALAAARAALDAHRPKDAIAVLEPAELPLLSDYRALYLGTAYLQTGQLDRARQELERIPELPREPVPCAPTCKHVLHEVATVRLATAWSVRDPAKAANLLLSLPADGPRFARAAGLLQKAQKTKAAEEAELRLLTEAPDTQEGRDLAKELGEAGLAERLGTTERKIQRIERFLDLQSNEDARNEARALLEDKKLSPAEGCRLRYVEGKACRKLREYGGALKALPKAEELCKKAGDTRHQMASALLEAQVRGIIRSVGPLKKLIERMRKDGATHPLFDDAVLELAKAEEREGMLDAARAHYREILETMKDQDQFGEAAWSLALEAIVREAWDEAEVALAPTLNFDFREPVDRARSLYWLARIAEHKAPAEACSRYRRVVMESGLGFYSWQALDRLRSTDQSCFTDLSKALEAKAEDQSASIALPRVPAIDDSVQNQRARLLFELGFVDEAKLELMQLDHPALSEPELVALALALDRVQAHREAQLMLRVRAKRILDAVPSSSTRPIWLAAYSRPYEREVEDAAKGQRVDPLLLLALAREESTFDPNVISWAGAIGLAQLMPGTAIGAYATLHRKKLDLARLTEPALNLELGAFVLKDGMRKFKDAVPLALGAYNGGSGLVSKNLPSAPSVMPLDLWLETFPVRETRRYMQRVTGTFGIYRFLYGSARPVVELPEVVTSSGAFARAPGKLPPS